MGLTTLKELLIPAQAGRYAVGSFTVWNIDFIRAVLEAAEELHAPVIVMFGPVEADFNGPRGLEILSRAVLDMIEQASVPAALHFDHAMEPGILKQALECGFTSVMYDGSRCSYEENTANTQQVVEWARPSGASVEAEIGKVLGLEGVPGAGDETLIEGEDPYTDPDQAREFAETTGLDALAVAIGTVHGVYKAKPNLDIERLKAIRSCIKEPLVLHGGSDTPPDQIQHTIAEGITKINVATDLRNAYMKAIDGKQDFMESLKAGRDAVKAVVKERITLFGSDGKG